MYARLNGRWTRLLWGVTGLALLLLIATTIALALKADQIEEAGIVGYITNVEVAPFLRERPGGNSPVITVLEYGTRVRIRNSTSQNDGNWYFVRADNTSGWLHESLVSFEPISSVSNQ